jgi:hypothetical protein
MNSLKKYLISPLKSFSSRFSRHMQNGTTAKEANTTQNFGSTVNYLETLTKHRMFVPVYDLRPSVDLAWVAPNATLSK